MSHVARGELQDLKKKLNALLPPKSPQERKEKAKRDRPYVPTVKTTFPDWWGKEPGTDPRLPLRPPGK